MKKKTYSYYKAKALYNYISDAFNIGYFDPKVSKSPPKMNSVGRQDNQVKTINNMPANQRYQQTPIKECE